MAGRRLKPGALARRPRHFVDVGEDARRDSAAVVAAPANQHHTELRYLSLSFENVALFDRSDAGAAISGHRNTRGLIRVIAGDDTVGHRDIRRVNCEG